jgi:hypothetical protein
MHPKFPTLLLTAVLAGCAASNIGGDYVLDSKHGTGVVAGTITYFGSYASYRLHIANEQSNQTYRIEHGDSQTLNPLLAFKGEAINPALQRTGSAFAVELPAGTYAVRSWQVSQGAANVWSTAPTGVQFTVQPGKAIYLGNFHFKETSRVMRAVTGASVSLNDETTRDIPALTKSFPSLRSTPITQSLEAGTRIDSIGGKSDGRISVPIPIFVPVVR